jgi:predicted DNA-binding antitoxin AbrB/MazE fold protein
MCIEVSATYENGILKLDGPLPFEEHQRVTVTVGEEVSRVDATYGLLGWTGDPQVLRRIALEDEFDVANSP